MRDTRTARCILITLVIASAGCGDGNGAEIADADVVQDLILSDFVDITPDDGWVHVESDTGDVPDVISGPIIQVTPIPVDFGVVGPGGASEMTLIIANNGTSDLIINEAGGCLLIDGDVFGEFGFKKDDGFGPTDLADCDSGSIGVNEQQAIKLIYTRYPVAAWGKASLKFTSNDPVHAELEVQLFATLVPPPTCSPVLVPHKLDFDVVPMGQYAEKTFKLINDGDGFCSFVSAGAEDCSELMDGSAFCAEPGTNIASQFYELMMMPPSVLNGIGPGDTAFLKVRFTPPNVGNDPGNATSFPGLLSAKLYDSQLQQDVFIPEDDGEENPGSEIWSPNLVGETCQDEACP